MRRPDGMSSAGPRPAPCRLDRVALRFFLFFDFRSGCPRHFILCGCVFDFPAGEIYIHMVPYESGAGGE